MAVVGVSRVNQATRMSASIAAAVLLVPYRRGEMWAWLVTWVEVAAFAIVYPLTDPEVGTWYLIGAVIAALAQAASLP
jgi:hypothetical protein